MDLLETLGLGAKQSEDNVVFYAIYSDALVDGGGLLQPLLRVLLLRRRGRAR
jgi:hypothetical protein